MSVHQQPELKSAILSLPNKEKDKLLLRLINKDKLLIKRLHFQLLEDESDLQLRVESLRTQLKLLFSDAAQNTANNATAGSIIALSKLVRQANGLVNEHEKVTKDTFSEIEFRMLILREVTERFALVIGRSHLHASHKLHQYLAARIKFVFGKWKKLHEDLRFDFSEDLQQIISFGYDSPLAPYLQQHTIPQTIR
ncbi:hypothetical protein M8998_11660 [Sphingobacterium sp. lm-10]|uniref:hypothetical protein n=1 Tax=Sphingobacterium sp. lm-10 TaxID=2944904 RepID=UPI00201FD093|nr:hypothetical protein [Sphingobacterium sp. lm-10]MCL7988593.1 hypothetical protein [Sphingobacterium sp. lm-10]